MSRFLLLSLLLLSSSLFSQESSEIEQLLQKGDSIVYSAPTEAAKIAQYVLENAQEEVNISEASYVLTRALYIQGRYDDALKAALEWERNYGNARGKPAIKLNILLATIYLDLGLYQLHSEYIQKAQNLATLTSSAYDTLLQTELLHDSATIHSSNGKRQQALIKLRQAKKEAAQLTDIKDFKILHNVGLDMARWHLEEFALDSAEVYLNQAYKESQKIPGAKYLEMLTLMEFGQYYFLRTSYEQSIESLEKAKLIALEMGNAKWQREIYEKLSANFLALDDDTNFKNYSELVNESALRYNLQEDQAINTIYTYFTTKGDLTLENTHAEENRFLLIFGGIIGLIILLFVLLIIRYRIQVKQFVLFNAYLEKQKEKRKESVKAEVTKPSRGVQIPEETEKELIQKLNEFEASEEYIDNNISLAQVASMFSTNTKYLSEIINSVKGSNFNLYINELRINYIIDKLRTNPTYRQYKVSYLAEESGFSSHSSFTTVFKSITGISPTAFISIINSNEKTKESVYEA